MAYKRLMEDKNTNEMIRISFPERPRDITEQICILNNLGEHVTCYDNGKVQFDDAVEQMVENFTYYMSQFSSLGLMSAENYKKHYDKMLKEQIK